MGKINSLNVFCGSNQGRDPIFAEVAKQLAAEMAKQEIQLVYGGAKVGLMGIFADTVLAHGGNVVGVIPQSLIDVELAHDGLKQQHVVKTMAERKDLMAELSDSFLLFPGGNGSLDEFFEVLTWAQLGFHQKPCAILNVSGYYDDLLRFMKKSVSEHFVKQEHLDMVIIEDNVADLLEQLHCFVPTAKAKWK